MDFIVGVEIRAIVIIGVNFWFSYLFKESFDKTTNYFKVFLLRCKLYLELYMDVDLENIDTFIIDIEETLIIHHLEIMIFEK